MMKLLNTLAEKIIGIAAFLETPNGVVVSIAGLAIGFCFWIGSDHSVKGLALTIGSLVLGVGALILLLGTIAGLGRLWDWAINIRTRRQAG